jgi:cysteine desulfurase/selenocysteine lyase
MDKIDLKPEDFIAQLTNKTKIVSFTAASNVLGNKIDAKPIIEAIRKFNKNIFICLDIAQVIQHYSVDLKDYDVDFAAFSCHKLFGPTGLGGAYIKKELITKIKPFKFGGGMNSNIREQKFDYKDNYSKFEGGTLNIAGIYG